MTKMTLAGVALLGAMALPAHAVPVNDLIDDAIAIAGTSGSLMGTTIDATTDVGAPFIGTSVTSPGVWYTWTATGTTQNLSTCNAATYDTKISVYSGYDGISLGSLIGVAGQDDGLGCAGFTTDLSFSTTMGEDLWVLVHGFGGAEGNFTLSYDSEVAAVPLPASALLLAGALAGLGLRTRSRKA